MGTPYSFFCFLALMLTVPCHPLCAETVDCRQGSVSVGDSRAETLLKCGEPDGKESHQEELIEQPDSSALRKQFITVEDWTYNFGPNQFERIVTLRNGKVTDIRTGGYGYRKDDKPAPPEFSGRIVSIGESKSEVLVKWGEPAWKDTRQEEFKERLTDGTYRTTMVTIDEWTYNLGPQRFMRILTFRNGKLTDITTGSYGR